MRKKTLFFVLILACLAPLAMASCKNRSVHYTDTLPAEELAEEVREELEYSDFGEATGDWLADYVTMPEDLTDYTICFSTNGNNLNEFGIWHVTSDQVAPVEATLRTYLAESLLRNRSFYDSYIPNETAKLAEAEVRVFGNYVCYAILNSRDRATFFHTVEEELMVN